MNELGSAPHLGRRWRYAVDARCDLDLRVDNGDQQRRRVMLEGAVVDMRSTGGVTEVLLVQKAASEAQAVVVLATRRWSDTVRARSLLTQLEMRCGHPAPQPA